MSEIIQSTRRSLTWPLTCLSFIECPEDWGPRDTCLVETHIRIFTTANSGMSRSRSNPTRISGLVHK
ncbi:hypothetical protein PanWU01x14_103780 [Parasponia andersonii]|uniref:Uncharacterized protein n=1 Tax=Parasponia andersonii TaxID=3476 RepID=A0A2P5D282_PARAD|nr:hypothetical protein PanWU01x14_103780 [Parasponia andersonii]